MFDKADLKAAIEAGALTQDQAARFEGFLKTRSDPDRMLDPENLRFLTNFNDVFLAIGMGVLIAGVSFLSANTLGQAMGLSKWAITVSALPVLAAAWALAEYFCGRRRLLLPSMVLAMVICASTSAVVGSLFLPGGVDIDFDDYSWRGFASTMAFAAFGGSALAALGLFYRFRLPVSLFLLAISIAGVFYTAVAQFTGDAHLFTGGIVTLIAGLLTLVAAIAFDARDPNRASIWSDGAFWLHMAAAPQIIFGLRGLILGSDFAPGSSMDAVIMLMTLAAFGVFSLALNRRALIVSGLLSFATALWVLVDHAGGGRGLNTLMLTALLVGGAIVLLGGGWRTARRALLKLVPHQGFAGRIFPPEVADLN
jgi:hypothetical protein